LLDVVESRESERDIATDAINGVMLETGDEKYMLPNVVETTKRVAGGRQ
jgi:hypothetical protein